jgi:hypothetical protein
MQKLYCYVEETGQDTKGDFFLVSVVVTGEEHDQIRRQVEQIEYATKRGALKWHKTAFELRLAYLEALIRHPLFVGTVYFSHYRHTTLYADLTVLVVAKAILQKVRADYKATVVVDGLKSSEVKRFTKGLRQLNIRVRKVRGIRDESDALIRLADSMAGFVRDAIEGKEYAQVLYQEAIEKGVIREIK